MMKGESRPQCCHNPSQDSTENHDVDEADGSFVIDHRQLEILLRPWFKTHKNV